MPSMGNLILPVRRIALLALLVCLVSIGGNLQASAAEQPKPNWSMSDSSKAPPGAKTAAAYWACSGTANTPHSLSYPPGVGFDARQTCSGAFGGQYVCVKLQYLDYYGTWRDRTAFWCNAYTVSPTAYVGRSVTCADAGRDRYRTYARGCAYPATGTTCRDGWSGAITLC